MNGEITGIPLPRMPHPCAYLTRHTASFEHYQFVRYDDDAFCSLIENGFRHFGSYWFRPRCPGPDGASWCGRCVPLRVPVDTFVPSRSQRRARRTAEALVCTIDTPAYTDEKYDLYVRHKQRFDRTTRSLDLPPEATSGATDAESFRSSFYEHCAFTREFTYRLDGRVVASGLVDVASRVVSSIYFFFDPDIAELSPGTVSVLHEIDVARAEGASHYYLGYLVRGNPSMRYKEAFRPNQVFDGRAWRAHCAADGRADDEDPVVAVHGPFLRARGGPIDA